MFSLPIQATRKNTSEEIPTLIQYLPKQEDKSRHERQDDSFHGYCAMFVLYSILNRHFVTSYNRKEILKFPYKICNWIAEWMAQTIKAFMQQKENDEILILWLLLNYRIVT